MTILDIAKKRYSVRDFKPQQIKKTDIATILETGRVAPTGANFQPFKLLVVQTAESLAKLSNSANIYGAPLAIIILGDHSAVWRRPFDNKDLVDIDTSIVTDHMMLAATELGIGSVWICYFKPDTLKEDFNLPDTLEPVHILALGYANGAGESPDRHDHVRKPIEEIVTYH